MPVAVVPPAPPAPEAPPLAVHAWPVGDGHVLHVSEHGNRDGVAALVLHGGPGSGCTPLLRRGFDLRRYRVVCVDQRGAGLSRPRGAIGHNDTPHLLADLRHLRTRLGIERWLVVGGSWGATLALLHAADAPEAIAGLLLRASFLARREDIETFFAGWQPVGELAAEFASGDLERQRALAQAWWAHEQRLATGTAPVAPLTGEALDRQVDRYRVQSHYLAHGCWLGEHPLVERCAAVPRVPTLLLHDRRDRVCPPDGALALQRALPHAALRWSDGAGHDAAHPAVVAAMAGALDRFAATGSFDGAAGGGAR